MRSPLGERGSLRRHRKNHAPARALEGLGPETSTAPAPHINASGPRQGHVRAASGPRQRRQKRRRYATFGAPSCPRACVPLWANADPFEGIEKTMLPLGFWRGWCRKRAPHQRPTLTRQGHARATSGPRQGRARGVKNEGGTPLLEPPPAPEHAFPSGRTRIPSKASKKPCSRSGSGGVGAGNEHRTSAPH